MKDKHYLIVDEMSTIGQRMFVWVDHCLHQATAKLDEPLGGISVILFGDFGQLPPVCDLPLYSNPNLNPLSIHGYTIYCTFSTVIILDTVLRQAGTDSSVCQFRLSFTSKRWYYFIWWFTDITSAFTTTCRQLAIFSRSCPLILWQKKCCQIQLWQSVITWNTNCYYYHFSPTAAAAKSKILVAYVLLCFLPKVHVSCPPTYGKKLDSVMELLGLYMI